MSGEKNYILVLSARDKKSLSRQAGVLCDYLRRSGYGDDKLTDLCYTLQIGRDVLENRVAFLFNSMAELLDLLEAFCENRSISDNVYVGEGEVSGYADKLDFSNSEEIADRWAAAGNVDWKEMYHQKGIRPGILPLPSYSFEKNSFWDANFAADSLTAKKKDLTDLLYYKECWKQCDDVKYDDKPGKGTVICFLPNDGFEVIKDYLNNNTNSLFQYIFVKQGYVFQTIENNVYTVRAEYSEFEYLFKVIQDTYFDICGIMYLWSLDVDVSNGEVFYYSVTEMIKGAAIAGLNVEKMLIAGGYHTSKERCLSESLVSLEKAVPMIIPGMSVKTVCISTVENDIHQCMKVFLDEFKSDEKESVLYENGVRKHLILEEVKEIEQGRALLDKNGVYCITGGMGGIGKVITAWLLRDYQATVILMGRTKREDVMDRLNNFELNGGHVDYIQADVCDNESMQNAMRDIAKNYGTVNGFFHAAGIEGKKSLLEATREEFVNVLAPKLKGTLNLIRAASGMNYKFMFLCSSTSAMLGDFGNCAYSLGNRFLMLAGRYYDERIKVINWPLWKDGGMGQDDAEMQKMYLTSSGQVALGNNEAMQILNRFLNSSMNQVFVIEGKRERIESFLYRNEAQLQQDKKAKKKKAGKKSSANSRRKSFMSNWPIIDCIIYELKEATNQILQIDMDDMGTKENFADFGYDSITLVEFAGDVSERFSERITPEVFFNYPTLERLGQYIWEKYQDKLEKMYQQSNDIEEEEDEYEYEEDRDVTIDENEIYQSPIAQKEEKIAIVGISGRFPSADNVDELWQIVQEGKDVIKRVPKERVEWWEGKDASQYDYRMGVVDRIKEFDPLFFEISPSEAETIDPRQRIILEEIWKALEDAGYGEKTLESEKIGVFVGAESGDYESLFAKEEYVTSNNTSLIAARIAYFLNFNGPNMTINTACSSGLTAACQAVRSIQSGDCDSAIVAGVSLACTSRAYDSMQAAGMLAQDRKCRAFDRKASGMVPAEAAAVIILKKEEKAREDGNYIYGLVAGAGINYDGKTNGITAPSGESQKSLLKSVYERNGIDPENIGLIMAHGTGTRLGDPIEMNALVDTFRLFTKKREYCCVTSVKSNLGHSLAASGIVSLIVLLMAMKKKKLPPQINCDEKSEYIKWEDTPFYINGQLKDWNVNDQGNRVGCVSAFGMGGTNVHFVVESTKQNDNVQIARPYYLIVLSAKSPNALQQKKLQMADYLEGADSDFSMKDLEFTLIDGRMHFKYRYAVVVQSRQEAIEILRGNVLSDREVYQNKTNKTFKPEESINMRIKESIDVLGKSNVPPLEYQHNLNVLAEHYSEGYELDGRALYGSNSIKRIALPCYPFEGDVCWIKETGQTVAVDDGISQLNKGFYMENQSDLTGLKYKAVLIGNEFYFCDHVMGDQPLFPGVGYFEFVRRAVECAYGIENRKDIVVTFRNVGWLSPISCEKGEKKTVYVSFQKTENQELGFTVYSIEDNNAQSVKCQGLVGISKRSGEQRDDLNKIKAAANNQSQIIVDAAQLYDKCFRLKMLYGENFQYLNKLYVSDNYVISNLTIAQLEKMKPYDLVPGILDGALQSIIGFTFLEGNEYSEIKVPFGMEQLTVYHPCTERMWAIARRSNSTGKIEKFDVDLFDENGLRCIEMRGYVSIALQNEAKETGLLLEKEQIPVDYLTDEQSIHEHVDLCFGMDYVPEGVVEPVKPSRGDTIEQWFQTVLLAVVEKTKEMVHSRYKKERNLQVVIPNAGEDSMLHALGALFKTAAKENPLFHGKVIEMDRTESAETMKKLLEAESNNMENVHVIYKHGKRFVERMKLVEVSGNGKKPWKDGGVYLITGGNGGLGRIFAKEIASSVENPVIILVGRKELNEQGKIFINELKDMGSTAVYAAVDVTREENLAYSIQGILSRYGKLNGILHCAGINYDNYLVKKKEEEIVKTLAPKVTGVVNLDKTTKDLEMDFFICFSSISGAIGSSGQADYAVANAFMDEYCRYRNTMVEKGIRKGISLSINWPLWRDGGMHVDAENEKMFKESYGIIPMPNKQGIDYFYLIWNKVQVGQVENMICLYGQMDVLRREIIDDLTKIHGNPAHSVNNGVQLFQENWIYRKLPAAEREQNVIVCIAPNRSFVNIVSSEIEICNKEAEVIWIFYDDTCKKTGSLEYCINYEQEEDYVQVLNEIKNDYDSVDTVLYLSPLNNKIFLQDLSGIVNLLSAVHQTGAKVGRMLLAGGYEDLMDRALAESLIGIENIVKNSGMTLSLSVMLGDKRELDYASFIHYMLKESASPEMESVSYENGERKVCRLETAAFNKEMGTPVKEHGSYIVLGNLAEVNLEIADYLSKKYDINLVVSGTETESEISAKQMKLQQSGESFCYVQADLNSQVQLEQVKDTAVRRYGKIDGVFYIADTLDYWEGNKECHTVMQPKVQDILMFEKVFQHEKVDFITYCFFTTDGISDLGLLYYAVGKRFISCYAKHRDVAHKVVTVNVDEQFLKQNDARINDALALIQRENMHILEYVLDNPAKSYISQYSIGGNDSAIKRQSLSKEDILENERRKEVSDRSELIGLNNEQTEQKRNNYTKEALVILKQIVSKTLKIPEDRIDEEDEMEEYGLTSIVIINLIKDLEEIFGSLPKTLFYEYSTLQELAEFMGSEYASFFDNQREDLQDENSQNHMNGDNVGFVVQETDIYSDNSVVDSVAMTNDETTKEIKKTVINNQEDIAIIGLSGSYPKSKDMNAFWSNLKEGFDGIEKVPADRWEYEKYANRMEEGKVFSQYGGFIEDVDKFDPLFFRISPAEAERTDPQERIFLEYAYKAIEDAGYTRKQLEKIGNVGVFVGSMYSEYQYFGVEEQMRGNMVAYTGTLSSIANRVSYFLNIHGPSMGIDTMCSSSLTAVYLACHEISRGRCDMMIAGGVNLSLHPNKYIMLAQNNMASVKGRCASFGEGGDGYVPSEGVGAVVLKALDKAVADGDHIYGVIKAVEANHGGKTSGYSVPNPKAQTDVIARAIKSAGINPETVNYIETHGTGTSLGDPIEITSLTNAYRKYTDKNGICMIGSVKSNIGHCEGAAGVAAISKVLLQLKHEQIVPSIHSDTLNPYIDFEKTPFQVSHQLKEWKRVVLEENGMKKEYPLRAGIQSFGAGGSNVHMIVEEYRQAERPAVEGPFGIVISAKTEVQVQQIAKELLEWINMGIYDDKDMASIAYTLQVGREAMDYRLAFSADNLKETVMKLESYLGGETASDNGIFRGGRQEDNHELIRLFSGTEITSIVRQWINAGRLEKVLESWVMGIKIDWQEFYGYRKPNKISLPTYPFVKMRCWADSEHGQAKDFVSEKKDMEITTVYLGIDNIPEDSIVLGRGADDIPTSRNKLERIIDVIYDSNNPSDYGIHIVTPIAQRNQYSAIEELLHKTKAAHPDFNGKMIFVSGKENETDLENIIDFEKSRLDFQSVLYENGTRKVIDE